GAARASTSREVDARRALPYPRASETSCGRSPMTDQHHDTPGAADNIYERRLSRASFLQGTAAAVALAGAAPALAARAAQPSPKRGGTLRCGFVGPGTAEAVNPFLGITPIDQG